MAASSALSRLIQLVSPVASLNGSASHRHGTMSAEPVEIQGESSGRRASSSRHLSSAPAVEVDSLPFHNVRETTRRRLSFDPDCTLASSAGFSSASALSLPSPHGLGYTAESALLAAQEKALRRNGVGSKISHIPDPSPAALDAFAASLIQSEHLEDAFYLVDIGALNRLFLSWQAAIPRATPYYAVKCNPSPVLLSALQVLGAGFDCASEAEIKQVLGMGVSPDRIIFANPCKMPSHIKYAANAGVSTTTFDSEAELDKICSIYPSAKLVLRIQTKDSGARCPLGTKYGALPEEVESLLAAAAERNLSVVGVSFHVGSGAADPTAYYSAIAAAHDVFQYAAACGRPMTLLDIGGGFTAPREGSTSASAASSMNFYSAAEAINAALDEFFPADSGVTIIAEPGRYFAETPSTLVARIFGKRVRGDQREYWVNDGLYGSMNCTLYDHAVLTARPLPLASSAHQVSAAPNENSLRRGDLGAGFFDQEHLDIPATDLNKTYNSTVFGPTCDGLDVIFRGIQLPDLDMGDWMLFPNMGAYTAAAGSSFNGFATSQLQSHLVSSSGMDLLGAPVAGIHAECATSSTLARMDAAKDSSVLVA